LPAGARSIAFAAANGRDIPEGAVRRNVVAHVVALLVAAGPGFAAGADDDPVDGDKRVANGWRMLRTVDCARCHGKDYTGLY
jgi:cytochrome c553